MIERIMSIVKGNIQGSEFRCEKITLSNICSTASLDTVFSL